MRRTSATLEARLAKRYPAPEYALMTQVYAEVGGGSSARRADAIALGLFPSRGLHLHGFEIKCDRGDWLRELRTPAKAESVARFCHFWWVVTSPDVVAMNDPFPEGWGHLEAQGGEGLRVARKAPKLSPEPLTIAAMAAMFRRFAESVPFLSTSFVPKDEIEKLAEERAAEIARRAEPREPVADRYRHLLERVTEFEEALGRQIITRESWRPTEQVAATLKALLDSDLTRTLDERLQFEIRVLTRTLDELKTLRGAVSPLLLSKEVATS